MPQAQDQYSWDTTVLGIRVVEQRFRRQAFYDLVWSEPLSILAPRFGICDVALAKICRRHNIPVPGRGHWAKLKAGKPSPQFPLPRRGLGAAETIHIGHSSWDERHEEERVLMAEDIPPPPEFTESLPDLLARVTKLVARVPQSRNLKSPHRAVATLLANDAERLEKWQQSSYPFTYDQPFYLAPYEQRRLKLVDAIFKAAAGIGMAPSIPRQKNPGEFTVRVGDTLGPPVHTGSIRIDSITRHSLSCVAASLWSTCATRIATPSPAASQAGTTVHNKPHSANYTRHYTHRKWTALELASAPWTPK